MAMVQSSLSSWYSVTVSASNSRQARWLAMVMATSMTRLLSYHILLQPHGHDTHAHNGHQCHMHVHGYGQPQSPQQQPISHRPPPKRLLPISITRRSVSTTLRPPPRKPILISDTIQLTDLEIKIFNTLKAFLLHYNLKTQLRVAGGWVRDKLLGKKCGDIDIALDDMLGKTFCKKLLVYFRNIGMEANGFGVIKSNPMQAKHLEVARMELFGVMIDFVNLRPHDYTESSSMPSIVQDFGTAIEDAFRRDLTINSLFYNINTEMVEDPTGRGLSDLRDGIIATPLRAKDTFMDDPLRTLRAIRFVATLDYELHPEAKGAIDTDIKVALVTKISRERIGGEVDRIFRSNQPLKAMKLLVEMQLFPIVFSPPSELEIILPEGIERMCLHALEAISEVASYFGSSKLPVDHRKSLFLAAFLSPFRTFHYQHKNKLVSVPTAIIKETLKLRSMDAAMVATLHKTAGNFTSIRKLILKMDGIDRGNGESSLNEYELQMSYSHAKYQVGMLLQEMRGLWRPALLLATVFEEQEIMVEMSYEKRKSELMRRSNLCLYVEEAIVRLGLDNMNGAIPFVDRKRLAENG